MMYDWLYSSHRCLIWGCLHWGIAYSSVMILWDDSLCQTHTSQSLSCTEGLPFWDDTFILRHSHLANFDIETPPLVYDCCFWWIIELLAPWVQSSWRAWSDLGTHFPLLHTHTSYIGHRYTCTHLIRAVHLLSPHISSSYMTLSLSLDQGKIWASLGFLVELSHSFGH